LRWKRRKPREEEMAREAEAVEEAVEVVIEAV